MVPPSPALIMKGSVTQVLGIRAFGSQLLCELVVGRGLRCMDYSNFNDQGHFKPEYVDLYGIPFAVIPFKGRSVKQRENEDKPVNHVRALPSAPRSASKLSACNDWPIRLPACFER